MTECIFLTDEVVKGLSKQSNFLTTLILSGCTKITGESIKSLCENKLMINSLISIDLSYCYHLNDDDVILLVSTYHHLHKINLTGIPSLSDSSVISIANNLFSLDTLKIGHCRLVTDTAITLLTQKIWLEALDISYCRKMTDESIKLISEAYFGLKLLNLNSCVRLTDASIQYLMKYSKNLTYLDVSNCTAISSNILQNYQQKLVGVINMFYI